MRDAITRSGYLFEQLLMPKIERAGFKAQTNHRFAVPGEATSRELDVFAIDAKQIADGSGHWLHPILLMECKNLEAPLVVFTQEEIRVHYFLGTPRYSGLPLSIRRPRAKGTEALHEFLGCDLWHHYYRGARAGRQFCVVAKRRGDGQYIAGHKAGDVDLFEAVEKLVAAVDAEQLKHAKSWVPGKPALERVNIQAYYPVLVTNGALYECFVGDGRPRYRRVHRIGLVHSRAVRDWIVDERIDIVDADGVSDLLRAIGRDTEAMAKRLRTDISVLEAQVATLIRRLKRLTPKERVRILLEQ